MDKVKTLLALIAVILVALAIMAVIGFFYTALQYLLMIGIVCLATVVVARFLLRRDPRGIDASDPKRELREAERTLAEYQRKHIEK